MAGAPLGNDNAKRTKPWRDAIDRALAQDDGKRLRSIAETLLTKAADGDMSAIRELGDRLDGKAMQAIEHSGDMIVTLSQTDVGL